MTHDDVSPVQTTLNGRASWLWPDGTVLPVVAGGDESAGDGSGGAGGDAGAEGTDAAGTAGAAGNDDQGNGAEGADSGKVEMTQAELDALITKRLNKAKSGWESEAKTAADKAKMDEADRLKAEKAEAEALASTAKAEALAVKVEVTAERLALKADIDPDKVTRFLKVAELGDLDDLTADGAPDPKAIEKAITKAVAEWPEFKKAGTARRGASGGDMNGTPAKGRATNLEDAVAARMNGG